MDWREMLKLSASELNEEQKDELCQSLKWLEIEAEGISSSRVKALFRLAQEILKYKDEQVEMLISEFDEIARKQGIEEAKIIQNLKNEIKSLKSSTESGIQTPDNDTLRENESLKYKIKNLKGTIKVQVQEIEKLKKDVIILEEERNMLQTELHSVHRDSDSQSEASEISEKRLRLTENIKQKNKQISQLLTEIETVEKENIVLKEKIVTLRDDLNEATEHISDMTTEISTNKNSLKDCTEKMTLLSEENSALRNQIGELVQQKENRESEIENFTVKLDNKIDELKILLEEKQSEIEKLKQENIELTQKLTLYTNDVNKIPMTILQEREEQIEELQQKLIEATKEIEQNTTLLNNISESKKTVTISSQSKDVNEDLKTQLLRSHERCQELQKLLESTEQDAQSQGQQLAELLNQLQRYEDGQYGLADAVKEMQECRVQIGVREKQISKLIQESNKLQLTCDEFEQENLALREKLGLPLDAPISKNGIVSKHRKQKKLINNLQNQIEILEDDKLQLKVDLQKYKRLLTEFEQGQSDPQIISEGNRTAQFKSENEESKGQIKELKEENEALRKGMHEILDSIRAKKGMSSREIKSESLEKLLHILDSRHVSGWYHPAMKLQAEINTLQGTNEELRNQLKLSRLEISKSNEHLLEAEMKLKELQMKAHESNEKLTAIDGNLFSNLVIPSNISSSSAEIISKLNSHLLVVLNEYHRETEANDKLKDKLESFKHEINTIRQQIGLLYKQHLEEKKVMSSKYEEMQNEKENLSQSINLLQEKLENYLKPAEIANIGQKISNDFISINRKSLFLQENEKKLTTENTKLKMELCQANNKSSEYIKELEISRNNLTYKLNILEKTLRDSVSKTKLENANKIIFDLTVKYRELLQSVDCFQESNNALVFKKEIELLNSEKDKLFFELLQMKSKSYLTEHSNDEIVILTKKLANFELNELSERQRADHVNSLYELVKEQLKKCEERCAEYENQNKLLLNTNLKFQLAQQELQDKIVNFVSNEEYRNLKEKLNNSEEELHNLRNKFERLQTKNNMIEAEIKTKEMLKSAKSSELMHLKHLLLDLQSASDEKALIARLSTEVVLARICESDAKNRLDIITNEMQQVHEDRKQKEAIINENYIQMSNIQNQFEMKYRALDQIITSLRQQYLGNNALNTQERIIEVLRQIYVDKQTAFNELQTIQKQKNDIMILQEQLNVEIKNTSELKTAFLQQKTSNTFEKVLEWHREKNTYQLHELKYRRNLEFKEKELQQALERIKHQDAQLLEMEEEILKNNNNLLINLSIPSLSSRTSLSSTKLSDSNIPISPHPNKFVDFGTDPPVFDFPILNPPKTRRTKNQSSQTERDKKEEIISSLRDEIKQNNQLISLKESNLQRQQILINELEENNESLKAQLAEKDKMIGKEVVVREHRNQLNVIDEVDMEEYNALKNMVTKLQVMLTQKEDKISKYETMLKQGKDEHSLAASRFQEEIKQLQITLQQLQLAYQNLRSSKTDPSPSDTLTNKTAIEQYVSQVHILEGHMAEMQTAVSSLSSQLQASRQEAVRWRTLANDRLKSIEDLRKEFDEQHEEEIKMYRSESEKFNEENITLKQELSKLRVEISQKSSHKNQEIQERDTKIHELTMNVMHLKNELKLFKDEEKSGITTEFSELELSKQLLETELETLKKRCEQVSNREKAARDEIRKLKGQLIKRPILSVRSDRSDRSVKEQLQKKISQLEKDLSDANEKLEKDAQFNEARRLKAVEDFTQWEKMKKWQQMAEKLKIQLASKTEDLEKVQQSYSSAKSIISRLEREKHILEARLKSTKNASVTITSARIESAEQENIRLKSEIDTLTAKLEMQQYHSGGLGAAMLQEKLEAQERKIAILEVSAKGTVEITAELERLNNTVALLQKANLRLEAENLELNLDLKKAYADGPFLREQIQHLERYIDVLKSEQSEHHVTNAGDQIQSGSSNKKVSELEKTVLSLKRLVEKLQAENKRLQSRPCSSNTDRKAVVGGDKYQMELKKMREQCTESVQRSTKLEEELSRSQKRVRFLENVVGAKQAENESSLSTELADVRAQLAHKSQLLDKVKILLQKAAIKERYLMDQVAELQSLVPTKETGTVSLTQEVIQEEQEPLDETEPENIDAQKST